MSKHERYIINQVLRNRNNMGWLLDFGYSDATALRAELLSLGDEFDLDELFACKYGDHIIEELTERWEEIQARREDARWSKRTRKLNNRKRYTRRFNMEVIARKDSTCSYRFAETIESKGLMACILEHEGISPDEPVVLNVMNRLPKVKDERGEDTNQQHQAPYSEAELFWKYAMLFSAGKTLWNFGIERLREIFLRAFPLAIDFASYNRRFRAPLVPGGYFPDMNVVIHNNHVGTALMGSDGAGCYDPAHPDMAEFVETYGAVGIQFTGIHPDSGTVFKGILVPRAGINDALEPHEQQAIWLDHLQVKGVNKKAHKAKHKVPGLNIEFMSGVHIGVMKAKTTFGRVSGCFETLENIGPNERLYDSKARFIKDKLHVRSLLEELTTEAIDKIGELGPDGLLSRACRDDIHLKRLGEFIVMANEAGANINPLDIPILQSKTSDSLRKTLWNPAQGAGLIGKYPMVVIDNTLEPGTCVMSNHRIGSEVACWRYPTILPQSLLVLKVVRTEAHHQVQGKTIPNLIFMNERDIVARQQGDDDGDEVGISTDPRVIELFRHRKSERVFHIEPEGQKLDFATDSEEGRKYIAGDPMGPVGKLTIMKAMLGATGRAKYELAFAVGIQEAIDSQKNLVRPTDVHKAADIRNWHCDENGEYHIHYKVDGEYVTDNFLSEEAFEASYAGEFPIEMYAEACDAEMIAAGCTRVKKGPGGQTTIKAGYPLGWRTQHRLVENDEGHEIKKKIRKAIAEDNWLACYAKQDGEFSNWVHFCHDIARAKWVQWRESFQGSGELPVKEVLYRVLRNLGHQVVPLPISWKEYNATLREAAGLNKFGKEYGRLNKKDLEEDVRIAQIDQLRAELDIKLSALNEQQLLTIWSMELSDCWWYVDKSQGGRVYVTDRSLVPGGKKCYQANRPNYAFTAVTNRHSAIMRLLGFETSQACDFLEDPARVHRVLRWIVKDEDKAMERFVKFVRAEKSHAEHIHDGNGAAIPLGDCKDCMSHLETVLIRHIRTSKTAAEKINVMDLVSKMNAEEHVPFREQEADEPDFSQPLW